MKPPLHYPRHLQQDIELAISILRREGCREIYLFGSVARGDYSPGSDLDLAVVGIPKSRFFKVYGELLSTLDHKVDLIGLDFDNDFTRLLKSSEALIRVA